MAELVDAQGSGPCSPRGSVGSSPTRGTLYIMPKTQRTTQKEESPVQEFVKIIPLGGLGEIGRNMTLIEYRGRILILDIGLGFPEEAMYGIDFIIPDISYLETAKEMNKKIVGIVLTHGHYDHIGAIPYLIEKIGPKTPIFAGALTKGIVLKRQKDFPGQPRLNIKEIKEDKKIKVAPFELEFVKLNHNILDTYGTLISTPVGRFFHTSDFKFDPDPVYDKPVDMKKLKQLGKEGILLLMQDSTGAEEAGHSLSEREIMKNLETIFKKAEGRIIASTFASLLNRIQQIIDLSQKYGRKVVIEGRTMKTNVEIAQKLGYMKIKPDTVITPREIKHYKDKEITIVCTGAQGEEEAALMRIVKGEHRFIKLKPGDTVIFSSSVVPGNERAVQALKDNILRQGVEVYHYKMMDIHASGHAKQEELKEMIKLLKPKFFLPMHGQYSMLVANARLAKESGIKEENIVVAENGDIVHVTEDRIYLSGKRVHTSNVLIEGNAIEDIKELVVRDRKVLSEHGFFVIVAYVDRHTGFSVMSPDIFSRGTIYLKESQELLQEIRRRTIKEINRAARGRVINWERVKEDLKKKIEDYIYSYARKRPIVIVAIKEI